LPEAVSFRERRGERMPVPHAIAVGLGVLGALGELHVRGVLHRDVTPAAVTLTPGETPGAVLTAVGLAADAALLGPVSDLPAEEVEHLAPEASGVLAGGVDERSDLLARWRHPELGLLGPADFIPLGEQSGLIEQIGPWVMRRACHDLAALRDEPGARGGMAVSVNLSPRQLRHHGLADEVRNALQQAEIPPEALVLEITETAIAGDTPAGISLLRELRRIGVRVAVDDFGSGSSLGQLRWLRVDLLKIDRVFLPTRAHPRPRRSFGRSWSSREASGWV